MERSAFYNYINFICIATSVLLVFFSNIPRMNFSFAQVLLLVALVLVIHLFKFIRIFLLLLEENLSIKHFLKTYIKGTFVSIVFPFKTGEIFKFYLYGHDLNNYAKSFIAIIIEKFFDIAIIGSVFVVANIATGEVLSILFWLLLALLVIIIFYYFAFPGIYYYLNKFLIVKNKSKNGVRLLRFLEGMNKVYCDIKKMLNGRWFIVFGLSILAWATEFLLIYLIFFFLGSDLSIANITAYISDAFFGFFNSVLAQYTLLCSVVFLTILTFIYIKKYFFNTERKATYEA